MHAVELAGRGKRIYDPLYQSIEEAVNDVYSKISHELTKGPYAIFGHSMGGIIAYELAYKIRDNHLPEPLHIFFSGRGAPHIPDEDEEWWHHLPDDEFKEKTMALRAEILSEKSTDEDAQREVNTVIIECLGEFNAKLPKHLSEAQLAPCYQMIKSRLLALEI